MSQMTHECFADEIAIDFPSVGNVVDRMRDAFLGEREDDDVLRREVLVSCREAWDGLVVPIDVQLRGLCRHCGGSGEPWTEPCALCRGTGESVFQQALRVSVPPRVADGACVRFRLKSPDTGSIRVELRIAIRTSAA